MGDPVKVHMFGMVEMPDEGLALMDGGVHGVQGHTITYDAQHGRCTWARRLDGFQPQGRAGTGAFTPTAEERAQLADWMTTVWESNTKPTPPRGPPRWVWAVVARRGPDTRTVEGAGLMYSLAPAPLAPMLAWLRERVDRLSEE